MKKMPIIVLMVVSLAFAGLAEAAKPRKRSRNANRVGPYAGVILGNAMYSQDQSGNENYLASTLAGQGVPSRNIAVSTQDSNVGYEATFGYRFNRYVAGEIGLVQYGELSSRATGELDPGGGFVPASLKLTFRAGGPIFSVIGILPFNDRFEMYGRVGLLFASSQREINFQIDGRTAGAGGGKGDSSETVYGAGFAWHINPMYTVRGEYQHVSDIGQADRTGTEKLSVIGVGLIVRF